jgi:glucose-1-phosphatase
MTAIKNIIFDLGGVLFKIDYSKTKNAFIDLGIENFDELYKQNFSNELFTKLEIGSISELDFYDEFRTITNSKISNAQIKTAWNSLLLHFWEDRIAWLNVINKKYKIFLFSNTNKIHYDCFINIYQQQFATNDFSSFFINDYYSHTMGMRKPNVASYQFIINQQQLIANETLFIDDTLDNIKGASLAGLQTLHLTSDINLCAIDL